MHRRRHGFHHPEALTRAALAVAAALLAAAVPARAETVRIDKSGTVHRVEVVAYANAQGSGTALRYTRQAASGGSVQSYIPGTDDLAVDRDPAIEINPSTGLPMLVWSRNENGTYALFFSTFDGAAWAAPRMMVPPSGDVVQPQIEFGTGIVHLAWRQVSPSGVYALVRWSFDATTFSSVYGPESVPLDDPPIPPSGGSSGTTTPCRADHFFAASLPGVAPGDPGRAFVWGVRDEPVPITFHQAFTLPSGVGQADSIGIGWLGGRFTLWFVVQSQNRVYYTVRSDSGWSDMRVVETGDRVTVGDARLLIQDRNRLGP